jgi:hypothetical protein
MRWDRVAPFTFEPFRLTWVRVQTRGWIGRVPYAFKPNGTFKVQSGVVELYNTELVEDPYTGHFGVNGFLWGTTKNLDRPSVLPEPRPQPVWARLLVQRFRFDLNSGQLTEVLPVGSGRNPFSCDKLPLFAADRY